MPNCAVVAIYMQPKSLLPLNDSTTPYGGVLLVSAIAYDRVLKMSAEPIRAIRSTFVEILHGDAQGPFRHGVAKLATNGVHLVVDLQMVCVGTVVISHLPLAIAQHAEFHEAGPGGKKLTHP
jgi:hypothetical protein